MGTSERLQLSFSARTKDELVGKLPDVSELSDEELERLALSILLAAGHMDFVDIQLFVGRPSFATWLQQLLERYLQHPITVQAGRERHVLLLAEKNKDLIYQRLEQQFSFDLRRQKSADLLTLPMFSQMSDASAQLLLQIIFLSLAAIADPERAYYVEFALRSYGFAPVLQKLLTDRGIDHNELNRFGVSLVYTSDSQSEADLLVNLGAQQAYFELEDLRVAKDLRNSINRVVNCDSANAQRIAQSAARQLQLLQQLKAADSWGLLPPDLAKTAELRLAAPAASLRELAEMAEPPIGKSGMKHRMRRLEQFLEAWMEKRKPDDEVGILPSEDASECKKIKDL